MKIVLMSFRIDKAGGAAEVPRLLARELVARGWDVSVVTTGTERRDQVTHADGWTHHQVCPWNLYWVGDKDSKPPWQRTLWQMIDTWNPHAYRVVSSVLDRTRPDVVHVHKLRGLSAAVWSAAGRGRGLPLVQTCHDYEAISPEGTLTSGAGRLASRGSWVMRPYQAARALASRSVDVVTAPTAFTLESVTRPGLFRNAEQRTVPNSHGFSVRELEQIQTRCSDQAKDEARVDFLYLGRLESTKGIVTLCRAFDAASRAEPRIRLTVAGWGELGAALEREYADHRSIRFMGAVDGDRKARLLADSDAIVVPSEWPEVFGIVVVEALAYGRPAIGSRVGGLPEVIEHGTTGMLIEPGDADGLAGLMVGLGRQPERLHELRLNCFRAADRYSVDRVMEAYLEAYERAIERHGS